MGASSSADKADAGTSGGGSGGGTPVLLHVYKPSAEQGSTAQSLASGVGFGIHHSGVQVHNTEYCFAGGGGGSGVCTQKPKKDQGPWKYQETINIGNTELSTSEVRQLVNELKREWMSNTYDLTKRNCNHFSNAFCEKLCGNSIPGWVNRAAKVGNAFRGFIPDEAKAGGATGTGGSSPAANVMSDYDPSRAVQTLEGVIDLDKVGVLNNDEDTATAKAIMSTTNDTPMLSDADEQLLFFIPFKQNVQVTSLRLRYPQGERSPKSIKLFANCPNMDFDDAADRKPTQMLTVPESKGEEITEHNFVLAITRFNSIQELTIFVDTNYGDEVTGVHNIVLSGRPC